VQALNPLSPDQQFMKAKLVELGMRLEKVPGDGNCGPHAAASFLAALSPELSRGIPSIGIRGDRGMGIRRAVKHYATRANLPHQRRVRLFEGDLWQRKDKPSKTDMMLSINLIKVFSKNVVLEIHWIMLRAWEKPLLATA
jgi:hypothetical protein